MKRRLLDLITRILLLIVVLTGAAACAGARGSICLGPDLRHSQKVYDAMNDAEAARHLAALKLREQLCPRRGAAT